MPGGYGKDQVPTWRRQATAVWLLLAMAVQSLLQLLRLFDSGHRRAMDTIDWGFAIFSCVLLAVSVTYFVFEMVRTRVRLLETGVEVRQWKTKLYRYADIADVQVDRATNDRTITLGFHDGRSQRLPAPTRGLRKPSDSTLPDAVEAIRDRAGLGTATQLP